VSAADLSWASEGRPGGKPCILCGRCLEVCPLFLATRKEEVAPRTKFVLTQTLLAEGGRERLSPAACERLAGLCLSCGRCARVCPQGLKGAELVAGLRAAHPGFATWLWTQWIDKAALFWPRAAGLARLLPDLPAGLPGVPSGPMARLAAATTGLKSLAREWRARPWLAVSSLPGEGRGEPVALFAGCTARYARPRWREKAEALLSGMGYSLVSLDFTCCGGTLAQAGQPELAAQARRRNLSLWRGAGQPRVVTLCASCHHALAGYGSGPGSGCGGEAQAGDGWAEGLTPLSALLGRAAFAELEGTPRAVYYHIPCHDENGGDFAFLHRVLDGRLKTTGPGQCCGFGGILGLADPALAGGVNARLWSRLAPAPGDQVVTGCAACSLRLGVTAPRGVEAGHWLDVLI
jgi:glycolate oxidase iron-sulfur subunit